MFLSWGLGTRSHTSFLWNWLSSSCIDSSCLKYDLVLLGLSLFPTIRSSRCEHLYLNVLLDWLACWEPFWVSLEATSSWTSGVGLASKLSWDSGVWSGFEVSSCTYISAKLSPCYGVSFLGSLSSNLMCIDSSTQSVSELYTLFICCALILQPKKIPLWALASNFYR